MSQKQGKKGTKQKPVKREPRTNKSAPADTAGSASAAPPRQRAGGSDWMERHLWQIQPVRDLLLGAAVFGVLYLGYVIRSITVPMLLALLLSYLWEPVIRRVVKKYSWMTRQIAATLLLVGTVFIVVIPLTIGLVVGIRQSVSVSQKAVQNGTLISNALSADDPAAAVAEIKTPSVRTVGTLVLALTDGESQRLLGPAVEAAWDVLTEAEKWLRENAGTISKRVAGTGWTLLGKLAGVFTSLGMLVFSLFLTGFFFFFFCSGYGRLLEFWESLIPNQRRGRAATLAAQMDRVIAGFVRGRLTICAIQSVVLIVGYALIGVPSPILLGIVVGLLTIVPYASGVGVPVAIALMFLAPDHEGFRSETWWILIAPTLLYMLVQALDDYFLTPKIQGDATDLDTPSVLFASLAGGTFAGIYGLLLAIPVAACAKILLREIVWPRIRAWVEGRSRDPLPIGEPVAPHDDDTGQP